MKKFLCICISLICVLSAAVSVSAADVLRIDTFTGEVVDAVTGNSTNYARITSDCVYNIPEALYEFTTSVNQNTAVKCSVYDGMVVTDSVSLVLEEGANVTVYKDGEALVLESRDLLLSDLGSYVIRNMSNEKTVLSFSIVNSVTGKLNGYTIPSIFYVTSTSYNGERYIAQSNTIEFTEEGYYETLYECPYTDIVYELDVTIDHTAPELEIIGVVDGVAKRAVTFGPVEPESTLVMSKDGEYIALSDELTEAGYYHLVYTDLAGNSSTYDFKINLYFDGAAWIFLGMFLLVVALAVGFMIYSRKHMRTR